MDYISFIGCRKTSNDLLTKIKQVSTTPGQLMDNLRSFNIFKNVTTESKARNEKIVIEEATKCIRVRAHSNGKRTFSLALPNMFGCGELIKADYNNPNDCLFSLSMPSFMKRSVLHNKIVVSSETKTFNDKKTVVQKLEVSSGSKSTVLCAGSEWIRDFMVYFLRYNTNFLGINCLTKIGFTDQDKGKKKVFTPFIKLTGSKSFAYVTERFETSIKLSAGRLFGSSNLTEKFFLGPEIRGYRPLAISPVTHNKKVGGNSFASVRTQAGVFVGPFELFAFADAGVTSVHGLRQCYEIASELTDNNCVGKSVGCGVSLKNSKGVSFIYSVPLTKNDETENYTLCMDINF